MHKSIVQKFTFHKSKKRAKFLSVVGVEPLDHRKDTTTPRVTTRLLRSILEGRGGGG